jgi:hypothetical protein
MGDCEILLDTKKNEAILFASSQVILFGKSSVISLKIYIYSFENLCSLVIVLCSLLDVATPTMPLQMSLPRLQLI